MELAQAWNCGVDHARQRKEAGETKLPIVPAVGQICSQYERTCAEIVKQRKLTAANDKRFVALAGRYIRSGRSFTTGAAMESASARNEKWTLTQEGLEVFLRYLDADRERAGEKYENIRCVHVT